jgi:hypothetical protein
MMRFWKRLKLPIAFALITSFTVQLLWYPMDGEHLARLGDQNAEAQFDSGTAGNRFLSLAWPQAGPFCSASFADRVIGRALLRL